MFLWYKNFLAWPQPSSCEMVITQINSLTSLSPYLPSSKDRYCRKIRPQFSKKQDIDDQNVSQTSKQKPSTISSALRIPKVFIAQSAIAVLGLGFIDAGYSGDWSRIGVITKENEELLKVAAFVVVPICLYLILSLPNLEKNEEKQ
ncbi:hypothetical protein MKW94_017594 [Papaver nudicaule]|uniref:DUF7887 domain-containing protein n=1 Tax=Papaver nudicaule TaxID=74823 RepID=A0AA41VDX2_PAPNU|nr:hypothetical protein [Papaver nudicaule]